MRQRILTCVSVDFLLSNGINFVHICQRQYSEKRNINFIVSVIIYRQQNFKKNFMKIIGYTKAETKVQECEYCSNHLKLNYKAKFGIKNLK